MLRVWASGWLPRFAVPLVLLTVVVIVGLTAPLGAFAFPMVLLIGLIALVVHRTRYRHGPAPDPELTNRPCWKL